MAVHPSLGRAAGATVRGAAAGDCQRQQNLQQSRHIHDTDRLSGGTSMGRRGSISPSPVNIPTFALTSGPNLAVEFAIAGSGAGAGASVVAETSFWELWMNSPKTKLASACLGVTPGRANMSTLATKHIQVKEQMAMEFMYFTGRKFIRQ